MLNLISHYGEIIRLSLIYSMFSFCDRKYAYSDRYIDQQFKPNYLPFFKVCKGTSVLIHFGDPLIILFLITA